MGCLLSARLPIGVYLTGGYPTGSYFLTLLAFDWVVPYVGDLVELRGVVCLLRLDHFAQEVWHAVIGLRIC